MKYLCIDFAVGQLSRIRWKTCSVKVTAKESWSLELEKSTEKLLSTRTLYQNVGAYNSLLSIQLTAFQTFLIITAEQKLKWVTCFICSNFSTTVIRFMIFSVPWLWCFSFQFNGFFTLFSLVLSRCGHSSSDNTRYFYFCVIGCCECLKILCAYYLFHLAGQFSSLQYKG